MSHLPSHDEEYVVRPVTPCEDELLHTSFCPFCSDSGCSCHEDPDLINEVAQQVEEGLLTPDEATHILTGQQI
jgi:hypothetical protein